MAKLISMKVDRSAHGNAAKSPMLDAPAYPYGLEITLDTEALEKLGLKKALPEVGATMTLTASVDVTRVSESESQGGEATCSVSLQITEMALAAKATRKSDADVLYE